MKMTDNPDDRVAVAHTRIYTLIGSYPDLSGDELAELLHWYRREASSYDVAMLSARDEIGEGYKRFYKDHIERISPRSWLVFGVCSILLAGGGYALSVQLL